MAKRKSPKKRAAEPPPAVPAALVSTIAGAAQRLGVHVRTLKDWLSSGCPGRRGAYDVDAIAAWRAANRAPRDMGESAPERAKWETRKSRAEAKIKELELQRKRERLVLVDRAVQVMRQHIAEVKTHLEQLPDRVASQVRLPAAEKKKLRAKIAGWVRSYCATFEASLRAIAKTAKQDTRQLAGNE